MSRYWYHTVLTVPYVAYQVRTFFTSVDKKARGRGAEHRRAKSILWLWISDFGANITVAFLSFFLHDPIDGEI
jgi:hypothetical protein